MTLETYLNTDWGSFKDSLRGCCLALISGIAIGLIFLGVRRRLDCFSLISDLAGTTILEVFVEELDFCTTVRSEFNP